MARTRQQEVEVKIRLPQRSRIRARLRDAGFVLQSRETEHDVVFDTPKLTLRHGSRLLRLRRHGRKWLLTYKGRPTRDRRYKDREEIETAVADGKHSELILSRLGFRSTFVYEKVRSTFRRPREPGLVALDHTPVGDFLELEGPRPWIDRTARRLGFNGDHYTTKSYGVLYREYCEERGITPTNMVFAK